MNDAKQGLRASMRSLRRRLPPAQRAAESAATCLVCSGLIIGEPASYAAQPDELDLSGLHESLWADGQTVLLPRVLAEGVLAWNRVKAAAALRPGFKGIPEPDPAAAVAVEVPIGATMLVPGLAFTREGQRLGQGGGYYDRLLAQRPDLRTIGVGFACQLVDELPCEAHDRPLRGLVIAGELVLVPH